jgi:hypothetical protein
MFRCDHHHLVNIKPTASKLSVFIKTHKENEPVGPVVNNTQAPSYKITKYLNKRLNNLINTIYVHHQEFI